MSVGAWILTMFGMVAVPGFLTIELSARHVFGERVRALPEHHRHVCIVGSAFWGMWLATYTGVLLGATAIPAWFLHRLLLPIHFGTAGLGSAAAAIELLGYRSAALNAIGCSLPRLNQSCGSGWKSIGTAWLIARYTKGAAVGLFAQASFFSGPLALVLRLTNLLPFAAGAFLLGALLSRFGWITAGRASGRIRKQPLLRKIISRQAHADRQLVA